MAVEKKVFYALKHSAGAYWGGNPREPEWVDSLFEAELKENAVYWTPQHENERVVLIESTLREVGDA